MKHRSYRDKDLVSPPSMLVYLLILIAAALINGCATIPGKQVGDQVAPLTPERELSDAELLNVSIQVFDPGQLPEDPGKRKGLSPEIREAESRFAPIHLKHTLQRAGYWGVVRVVPDEDVGSEILVQGAIVYSDGENASLQITVTDARNVIWFQRTYAETARQEEHLGVEMEKEDVFQDLFNTIANDLLAARKKLKPGAIDTIREVAELKFAADLAPDAFADYLETNRKGRQKIERLPAEGDPMVTRIAEIRERDYMFVDTLNEHYAQFCTRMDRPYDDWRAFSYEEQVALQELRRAARMRKIMGALAIFGAVVASVDTGIEAAARDAAIIGGTMAIQSGIAKGKEAKMHAQALRELGVSFEAEVAPMVIEVKGQTLRLAGSAETQYASWRELLTEIYAEELGLPVDPNTGAEISLDQPATD